MGLQTARDIWSRTVTRIISSAFWTGMGRLSPSQYTPTFEPLVKIDISVSQME